VCCTTNTKCRTGTGGACKPVVLQCRACCTGPSPAAHDMLSLTGAWCARQRLLLLTFHVWSGSQSSPPTLRACLCSNSRTMLYPKPAGQHNISQAQQCIQWRHECQGLPECTLKHVMCKPRCIWFSVKAVPWTSTPGLCSQHQHRCSATAWHKIQNHCQDTIRKQQLVPGWWTVSTNIVSPGGHRHVVAHEHDQVTH
jgi:hypothetical protein